MRTRTAAVAGAIAALTLAVVAAQEGSGPPRPTGRPVVVASKPFAESYLLAELFAQLLEARGQRGDASVRPRRHRDRVSRAAPGHIDVYPEYTGTGLLVILKAPPDPDPLRVFDIVSREFRTRYDVQWLPPLGFENTYAMSIRTEMAERLGIRTLSDFARVSREMRAGFTADFIGLPDGLPGLSAAYDLQPKSVSPLAPGVKYQALMAGSVDIIDAYSTDGLLGRYPITVLEDDRRFFPPYDAAAMVRGALARDQPSAVAALGELSGRVDVVRMRQWNERVEVNGEPAANVARDALQALGLTTAGADPGEPTAGEGSAPAGLGDYLWSRRGELTRLTARHLLLAGVSLLAAVVVGVPLGLVVSRTAAAPTWCAV